MEGFGVHWFNQQMQLNFVCVDNFYDQLDKLLKMKAIIDSNIKNLVLVKKLVRLKAFQMEKNFKILFFPIRTLPL